MVNYEECDAAGLDAKEVARIAKGLKRYAKQADDLGLKLFGGSSSLTLRFKDDPGIGDLIVADGLANNVDGGCGSTVEYGDGLLRGEF